MSATTPSRPDADAAQVADELERLDKLATPGPWQVQETDDGFVNIGAPRPGNEVRLDDVFGYSTGDYSAALTVALRNNLPLILAALRQTAGERERIVAWLRSGEGRPSITSYYEDMRGEYVHDLADAIERGDHLAPPASDAGEGR